MLDSHALEQLTGFQSGEYFVTSLFLNVDRRRFGKKEYEIKFKALARERKQEIQALGLSAEVENQIFKDIERLAHYVNHEIPDRTAKSIAAFSCQVRGLWQTHALNLSLHPRLVVSKQPHIRPLNAILAENKRYFVVLVSKTSARFFENTMGNLTEETRILHDIPHATKEAGWYGLKERRIQRHIDDRVHRHFKHTAETALGFVQSNRSDHVIICGRKEILPEFERHLNRQVRRKIITRINLDPEISVSDLQPQLAEEIRGFEATEQGKMVASLFEEEAIGGLAVLRLQPTLDALHLGQVNTLVVTEDHSTPGTYCPECWYLSGAAGTCPNDQTPMEPSHDVIEDAIETAMYQNCEIVRVKDGGRLGAVENIGAFLRFRL